MVKSNFEKEKSMARIIAYALLAVVIVVFACLARTSTADEEPLASRPSEFVGKIVTVYLNCPEGDRGHVLRDVKLIEIGGRKMLVGIGVDTKQKGNWTTGVRVGVAWDMVMTYFAMTPEEFEKKAREYGDPSV